MKTDEAALAKAVGKTIAKKRLELGLTQEDVAERLEIGYEAVSRIERGAVIPSVIRLAQFAEIFGCGIGELLMPASHRSSDQAVYLANTLKKLSVADRRLVIEIAEKLAIRLS